MIYRFAEFELDPNQFRLTRGDEVVPLQPKVFEALLLLVQSPGQLIAKQYLMDALWPDTFVNEEALAQVIFKLRRALGDTHGEARFVQTVLKRGFRFLPEVTEDFGDRQEDIDREYRSVSGPKSKVESPGPSTFDFQTFDLSEAPRLGASLPQAAEENDLLTVRDARAQDPLRRAFKSRLLLAVIALALTAGAAIVIHKSLKLQQQSVSPPPLRNLKVRRVTFFPERDQDADIAPDGKSLVFTSKHGGDDFFKLYMVTTAGGTPFRLTRSRAEEHTPRFSPDGQRIAYTRNDKPGLSPNVWMVAAMGGQESLLAANAALPDWSPDGREIVFVRALANGEYALMKMSLEDKSERQILRWTGLPDMPAWSPDGSRIAFVNEEAVWVVLAQGGRARRITEENVSVQTLVWTPDSLAIICDTTWGGRRNLWMVPLDAEAAPVPITSGSGVDIYPSITPDWKYLLYTNEHWQRLIWLVDKEGKRLVNIQTKPTFENVSIDPAGRLLAYSDYEPANANDSATTGNEMGVIDIETLEQRRLGSGKFPMFSPDGKRLAFLRPKGSGFELHVMEIETGTARRITQTPGAGLEPAWSPDGNRIVFQRTSDKGSAGLSIVEVSSGQETFLAEGHYEAPAWSPDGRWIAAAGLGNEGSGLYLFDTTDLRGRRISETRSYEAAPVWVVDSRSLQVLIEERTKPTLVTLNLEGAEVSRMELEFKPDSSFWGVFHVKSAPSGYLYLLQRVEGDIYLLENPAHGR